MAFASCTVFSAADSDAEGPASASEPSPSADAGEAPLLRHRLELRPVAAYAFVPRSISHAALGLEALFYVRDRVAVGADALVYGPFSQSPPASGAPASEYAWSVTAALTFVHLRELPTGGHAQPPAFEILSSWGTGAIATRPVSLVDPSIRSFPFKPVVSFSAALGARMFLSESLALDVEIRDVIFNAPTESALVAAAPAERRDPGTFYGESRLTNAVLVVVGLSLFVPPR